MSVKILVAGDFCPIGRNKQTISNKLFENLFGGFEKYTNNADYSIVNLECPVTCSEEKIVKTGPNIKSEDPKVFEALKYAQFDLLTLANNHILDYGENGVIDTISSAKTYGFDLIGAGRDLTSASEPLLKSINGVKFGFINIAENEFCAATNSKAGANTFDIIRNYYSIISLKKKCDKIVLLYHGGREHHPLPSPQLRDRLRFFTSIGVDCVVAHHTHCFSGYEFYNDNLIVYGLGNFIFDYKKKYQKGLWTKGYAANIIFSDKIDLELIPFNQGMKNHPNIKLLNKSERCVFDQEIIRLNKIISDDLLFNFEWQKYLKTQKKEYFANLTIQNKYLRFLIKRGFFPMLWHSKPHKVLLLNMMRCESHRELLLETINKEI